MPVLLYKMQAQYYHGYRSGMRVEKGRYEMNKIKVIMASHPNCKKLFMFEVPNGMEVHRGNVLLVNTMRGKEIAICSSEPIDIDTYDVHIFGAYLPLKKVIQCAGEQIQDYINSRCKDKIKSDIENYLDDGLPF